MESRLAAEVQSATANAPLDGVILAVVGAMCSVELVAFAV